MVAYSTADVQMVESHIIQGERHIVRQQELIDRLRSRGLPTMEAEDLLLEFEATLQAHWEHRAIMLEEIKRTKPED